MLRLWALLLSIVLHLSIALHCILSIFFRVVLPCVVFLALFRVVLRGVVSLALFSVALYS